MTNSTESVKSLVEKNYLEFGKYINWFRAIPSIDGLKPVQRRVLIAARSYKSMSKTVSLVGDVIKKWHPHGDASVVSVVSDLVRKGLLEGQGNHGINLMEKLPPAAPRYTEVCGKHTIDEIMFKLVGYAPHFENEMGYSEPEYLILPVPVALVYGTFGIGLGVSTRIPAFTYKSLLEAYKYNDPNRLKSQYGYNIVGGDLKSLWNDGVGSLSLSATVNKIWSNDDNTHVSTIECSGDLFSPRISVFDNYINSDRIMIRDESDEKIKLIVARTKGTKLIGDNEVFDLCKTVSVWNRRYDIKVNVFGKVKRIGIKDWLDVTINLYDKMYNQWKIDETSRLNDKIIEYNTIPKVVPLLTADKLDDEIKAILNISQELLNKIKSRPLSILRKSDLSANITEINNKITAISKATANYLINSTSY